MAIPRKSIFLVPNVRIEVTCFSLVAVLLSPFGLVTVAAHSIAMNVSSVIFMLLVAIASADTIRVGEALGAGHWNRALRSSLGAYLMVAFVYVGVVLTIIFLHQEIIELYSTNPEVITLAVILLLICAVCQFSDSMQMISIGILRGFKDSKAIFAITMVSYWVIGIPIGYCLAYGYLTGEKMAAQCFWIGFICALTCASILYLSRIISVYRKRKLPKTFNVMHFEALPL